MTDWKNPLKVMSELEPPPTLDWASVVDRVDVTDSVPSRPHRRTKTAISLGALGAAAAIAIVAVWLGGTGAQRLGETDGSVPVVGSATHAPNAFISPCFLLSDTDISSALGERVLMSREGTPTEGSGGRGQSVCEYDLEAPAPSFTLAMEPMSSDNYEAQSGIGTGVPDLGAGARSEDCQRLTVFTGSRVLVFTLDRSDCVAEHGLEALAAIALDRLRPSSG